MRLFQIWCFIVAAIVVLSSMGHVNLLGWLDDDYGSGGYYRGGGYGGGGYGGGGGFHK